jgi:rod shape-determining protein MreC|tara:strand:- start:125 stop:979 length:855 start_codon:yes stop_codon:yes gene_type:complete
METSRDDFVIAIRSAFLKKQNQQRFSLLGLIIFSLLILILGGFNFKPINYLKLAIKEIAYRSTFIVSIPEKFIKEKYQATQNHINLYNINEKNALELKDLRAKDLLNNFLILENQRLKMIFEDYLVESDRVYAKVLSDKNSPFLKSIIINKGSKHGVNLSAVVKDKEYLIGKVVEVNYATSRVLLLSDINSKIPVLIEPQGLLSILSGSGDQEGVIQYSKVENIVEDKSIVYTSGVGGLFKAGIPVGKITKSNTANLNGKVEFFSDFSQLKFIEVLFFEKKALK